MTDYKHTYDDVKSYRRCIQQMRERLENPDLSDGDAIRSHESIEIYEKWIHEAGYQIDYRQGEEPADSRPIVPEKAPIEMPNYTAYFRLRDGTTDAWDFHASSWMEANQKARRILNQEYREWVEVRPRAVVRGGIMFVHYTYGKKPVGKRLADIVGLKLKEGDDA